jgi:hypothetical protein
VALYWAPSPDDPLTEAGNGWLGRDVESGATCTQPAIPGIEAATEAPRLYGFHATLRPPMRLATGWEAFMQAAQTLAGTTAPFMLPKLSVQDFGGFLALRETSPCPALHMLADACVRATDPHRLPADAAELARRRAAGLTQGQAAMLQRWGYPHVMRHWRFHMTLSKRLEQADMARLLPQAKLHFAASLAQARQVRDLAVFVQHEACGPFLIAGRLPLGGDLSDIAYRYPQRSGRSASG